VLNTVRLSIVLCLRLNDLLETEGRRNLNFCGDMEIANLRSKSKRSRSGRNVKIVFALRIVTRSQAVARIADRTAKNCRVT